MNLKGEMKKMSSPEVQQMLENAVHEHTIDIIANYEYFKNRNEYFGVLSEEIVELKEAYIDLEDDIDDFLRITIRFMRDIWDDLEYDKDLEKITGSLWKLLLEVIDVLAVLKKLKYQIESRGI